MRWIKIKYKSFHESISKKGVYWFAFLLLVLGGYLIFNKEGIHQWIGVVISAAQVVVFVKGEKFGRHEYAVSCMVTFPIGFVVSTVLLGAVYYLVFTPIGLIRKKSIQPGWIKSSRQIDPSKLYD